MKAAQDIHDKHPEMYKHIHPEHSGEAGHLATYINHTVRTGDEPSVDGLKKHIADKSSKEVSKLKTPAAQAKKQSIAKSHADWIDNNKSHYANLLKMHSHLQKAKNTLVDTLQQHEGGLEHHIDGKRTGPEGFVVNHAGEPTKLVNRAEFARANLLKVRK
jgi:1,6-anhydro-N-acetylmuramate kinase